MKIQPQSRVSIHYRLFDAEGALVESTYEDEAVSFVQGSSEILPALESALEGQAAGAQLRLALTPDEAFGTHSPEGIVSVPRSEFPPEQEYHEGDWIGVSVVDDEGEDGADEEDEREMEMRVLEIREDAIILDANHPLAGQEVTFEVEVVSVEPGTA